MAKPISSPSSVDAPRTVSDFIYLSKYAPCDDKMHNCLLRPDDRLVALKTIQAVCDKRTPSKDKVIIRQEVTEDDIKGIQAKIYRCQPWLDNGIETIVRVMTDLGLTRDAPKQTGTVMMLEVERAADFLERAGGLDGSDSRLAISNIVRRIGQETQTDWLSAFDRVGLSMDAYWDDEMSSIFDANDQLDLPEVKVVETMLALIGTGHDEDRKIFFRLILDATNPLRLDGDVDASNELLKYIEGNLSLIDIEFRHIHSRSAEKKRGAVFSIHACDDEPRNVFKIFVNGNYDEPISVSRNGKSWSLLLSVCKGDSIVFESTEHKSSMDYLIRRDNKICRAYGYKPTKLLKRESNRITKNIGELKVISENSLKRRVTGPKKLKKA